MIKFLSLINIGSNKKPKKDEKKTAKDSCQSKDIVAPGNMYPASSDIEQILKYDYGIVPDILVTEYNENKVEEPVDKTSHADPNTQVEDIANNGHAQYEDISSVDFEEANADDHEDVEVESANQKCDRAEESESEMIAISLREQGVLLEDNLECYFEASGYGDGDGSYEEEEAPRQKYREDAKMATSGVTSVSGENDEDEDEDDDDNVDYGNNSYAHTLIHSDTSEDVDNLPSEALDDVSLSGKFVHGSDSSLGQSIHKTANKMEEDFENEKDDIMKGFMIEKKMLTEEHNREKDEMINEFVKEKHDMLEKFHYQVAEIEKKLRKSQGNTSKNTSRAPEQQKQGPVLIKINEQEILTPEEFLSTLKLEEKYESEKEDIEKEFRKQRKELVEKLRLDYNSSLINERIKYETTIEDLKLQIHEAQNKLMNLDSKKKQQMDSIELDFEKERLELQRKHELDCDTLRLSLESQCEEKLRNQRVDYDKIISNLQEELKKSNEAVNVERDRVTDYSKRYRVEEIELRRTLRDEIRFEFEKDIRQLREENVRLMNEAALLGNENMQLSRQVKSMELTGEDRDDMLEELSQKLNQEYEAKLKNFISENEQLGENIRLLELERDRLLIAFQDCENEEKKLLEKFDVRERAFLQQENKIEALRTENEILSKEVSLLREEKETIVSHNRQCEDQRRKLAKDVESIKVDYTEAQGRCKRLEQEKLLIEKSVAKLRKEIQQISLESGERERQYKSIDEESEYLRRLLESERKEHERFRKRFQEDADLIRKKEKEISELRQKFEEEVKETSTNKSKQSNLEHQLIKLEAENTALQSKIHNVTDATDTLLQQERVLLQQKFMKEFTERAEYIKSSYERENHGLRRNIAILKKKLEESDGSCYRPRHPGTSGKQCLLSEANASSSKGTRPVAFEEGRTSLPSSINRDKEGSSSSNVCGMGFHEKYCHDSSKVGFTMEQCGDDSSHRVCNPLSYSHTTRRDSESKWRVPVVGPENYVNTDLFPTKESQIEEPSRLLNGRGEFDRFRRRPQNGLRDTMDYSRPVTSTQAAVMSRFESHHHTPVNLTAIPQTKPPLGSRSRIPKTNNSDAISRESRALENQPRSSPGPSNYFSRQHEHLKLGDDKLVKNSAPVDSSSPNTNDNSFSNYIDSNHDYVTTNLKGDFNDNTPLEKVSSQGHTPNRSLDTESDIVKRLKEKHLISSDSSSIYSLALQREQSGKTVLNFPRNQTSKANLADFKTVNGGNELPVPPTQSVTNSQLDKDPIDMDMWSSRQENPALFSNSYQSDKHYAESLKLEITESNKSVSHSQTDQQNIIPMHVPPNSRLPSTEERQNLLLKEVNIKHDRKETAELSSVGLNTRELVRTLKDEAGNSAYMKLHTKKLENAIASLGEKISTDHQELMQSLQDLNKDGISSHQYTLQSRKFQAAIERVRSAEKDFKDVEIRKLLKQIRREVLILNTLLEKERSSASSTDNSPRTQNFAALKMPIDKDHDSFRYGASRQDIELMEKEAKLARLYASDLRLRHPGLQGPSTQPSSRRGTHPPPGTLAQSIDLF